MSRHPDDAFRFEVPTPRGSIVVIAPSEMTEAEVAVATATICRVLPLLPVEPAAVPTAPEADGS